MTIGPAVTSAYERVAQNDRLYGGEVLANVIERQVIVDESDELQAIEVTHSFAVIVSQDCDLEQDARARADSALDAKSRDNALVPHVLLLTASSAEDVRSRSVSSRQWERVRQNKDERFQFLCGVPSDFEGGGTSPLVLDFKRFFSFPTSELIRRIELGEAKRRGRLATPYAEHLAVRFGFFLQRVGLVGEHHDLDAETRPKTGP